MSLSGDTTRFIKQGATQMRFYSPAALRLTLYISLAALGVMIRTLLEWKSIGEDHILPIDRKILWVSVAYASANVWLSYIDKSFARLSDEKKRRDEMKKTGDGTQQTQLKTLG